MQKPFLFPGCGARLWAGQVLFFRSNGYALRAGAPVARGRFSFSVKWLALRAGQSVGLVFSLSWFARWWRGAGFLFRSNGFALRAGQR